MSVSYERTLQSIIVFCCYHELLGSVLPSYRFLSYYTQIFHTYTYILVYLFSLDLRRMPPLQKKKDDIYTACRKGEEERVSEYISKGGCITEADEHSMTMLHHLAFSGNVKLIQQLLAVQPEQSVDIDAADGDGWTPLHYSADRGHLEVVKLLLSEGASVASKDTNKRTPLHLAALNSHKEVVQVLLEDGASKSAKNVAGMTPFDCAKISGNLSEEVLELLKPN